MLSGIFKFPGLLLQLKDRSTLFIYKNDKQES